MTTGLNLLKNTTVYLSGPIEWASDRTAWRAEFTKAMHAIGVRVMDPLVKPDWFPYAAKADPKLYLRSVMGSGEMTPTEAFDGMAYIRKLDLRYVHACDWLVVYLPKEYSAGTSEELTIAAETGKPILIFSPDHVPGVWLLPQLATIKNWREVFFPSKDSILEYISNIDAGLIPLDPVKWCFLSYFRNDVPLLPQRE